MIAILSRYKVNVAIVVRMTKATSGTDSEIAAYRYAHAGYLLNIFSRDLVDKFPVSSILLTG